MKYLVYKITNNVNGKIYIGMHRTDIVDDGYMGSGKLIKCAIAKYGVDVFTREVLFEFNNLNDMIECESVLVNTEFVLRDDTYNIALGGSGGFDHIDPTTASNNKRKGANAINYRKSVDLEFKRKCDVASGDVLKLLHKKGLINYDTFSGKRHTELSKRKIGQANAKHQTGEGNSQYGKCWIYNLTLKTNKCIISTELNDWLSKGWVKGRKMKF